MESGKRTNAVELYSGARTKKSQLRESKNYKKGNKLMREITSQEKKSQQNAIAEILKKAREPKEGTKQPCQNTLKT